MTVKYSAKLRQEAGQKTVQVSVFFAKSRDLPDGVERRRVVLVAEEAADLRKGKVRRLLEDVHRDLSRKDDLATLRPGPEIGRLQAVVGRDGSG